MSEIVYISSGKNKSRAPEGNYCVYGSTDVIAKTNEYKFDIPQILVARVGANAGYVHIASGKYDVSDNTLIIAIKNSVYMMYLYHYLVNKKINNMAKGGGQPLITASDLGKILIPLPPLSEQKRIADILDRFEALTTDLSEGLPAEIAAVQEQYEYYRNKLLTFNRLSA